jgi:hemoglobin
MLQRRAPARHRELFRLVSKDVPAIANSVAFSDSSCRCAMLLPDNVVNLAQTAGSQRTYCLPITEEITMGQAVSTSITRRGVAAGLALAAAPGAILAAADNAYAQAKQTVPEKSLYERLGGVFAISAVVDHFSDAVVKNPIVGQKSKNPQLQEWHTKNLGRLPGLKFMRTLWVCNVSGGPFQFAATKPGKTPLGLEEAHRDLRISPAEFDEVAAELGRTLDFVKVPTREKGEVLAAFAAHKDEVTAGYVAAHKGG